MSNIPDSLTKDVTIFSLYLDSKFTLRVVVELLVFPDESNALYRIELVCKEDGVETIEVVDSTTLEFLGIDKIKDRLRLFKMILEKSIPHEDL